MKQNKHIWLLTSFLLVTLFVLSGCSTVKIEDYADTKPVLKIEDYFNGTTKAWGVFQDRFGKVRRQFTVDIKGTWNEKNQELVLVEDFVYDDGETEQRIWTINKTGESSYTGSAKNVVGLATGQSAGNAFNFRYIFDLPVQDKIWRVSFDDWMYLQPDKKTLFNKATIRRYGLVIGDVYIFFRKEQEN
jgi:hypothetical protein